ncbi:DUF4169 family protein [uncultured Shimia sp.]|uniref:DUF4169 family protein n=1 Tax=uncultured Shimia sp. TaxID=573152 RepID=UPI0025DAAF18|nr:DUF4169 family protein [uncultured Shimia sp.]
MTVVNLNKFRKAKARANKQTQANENAVKFGRTKAQKQRESTLADKARQELDGNERE